MIVGLSGKARSGKDTLAAELIKQFGFRRASFADNLRRAAQAIFGFTWEQMTDQRLKAEVDPRWGMSPREALQKLGTEGGRDVFGVDLWIKSLFETTIAASPAADWVISDCRFMSEAHAIRAVGGHVVRLERAGAGLTGEAANHRSEIDLDRFEGFDAVINNDGPLEGVPEKAAALYLGLLKGAFGSEADNG